MVTVRTWFSAALLAALPWGAPGAVGIASAANCNGDGVDDTEEIGRGDRVDCDANGVPDECDTGPLPLPDACGLDPTLDSLRCDSFAPCQ